MSTLKVVCLISGGKDSLFSILHCMKHGHSIVALANLHPPDHEQADAVEDLDSYMYQTVGHSVIPLYKKALGLPLYRQAITGLAKNQDKCYGPSSDEDEAEALLPLLRKVMSHHPEVNAVSTGAILSDYQRTRVESVAIRLGLTPLSYLWQWPNLLPHSQDSLLKDMAEVGQDSRIIKVASGGLDESNLWQNVADTRTISRLNKAVQRFGSADDGAVLGEGGEYETLALSGPFPLWKGRIKVDDADLQVVSGEAGSASVRVAKAEVQSETGAGDITNLRQPPLLEPQFHAIWQELRGDDFLANTQHDIDVHDHGNPSASPGLILLADIVGDGANAAGQMAAIMDQSTVLLEEAGHKLADVAYTSIVLRDMADFASVNAVYGSYFVHPNPPARATIACPDVVPDGKRVMVALTSFRNDKVNSRKGLHVQSRSYWAPANIGPYSQAISISEENKSAVTYVAGQIPLVPATMEPVQDRDEGSFGIQTVLALQHLDRIGRAMRIQRWNSAVAFIATRSNELAAALSRRAHQAWQAYHQPPPLDDGAVSEPEDESFDVWHSTFGGKREQHWGSTPDHTETRSRRDTARVPPLHVVRVQALPRGCNIEWVGFGLTNDGGEHHVPHAQHLLRLFQQNII
ncbi:uncharacterized protein LTR77_002045 [Saxophila tyrrhenica]|uniref:Diphthine--ammonia ligase n=1 Tax=Saxophila tyrrhenica TaxID=1690608 RepID=A0AAV9PIE0_9PEZI|nr:hypothetical protein LTR77_002045 [Saxophila tyrrhenica]